MYTHPLAAFGYVAPSVTYGNMWINRSYKTRLLGDFSNKRQTLWRIGKQRTELGTKAQQNLRISLGFYALWRASLGEKARCGGVNDSCSVFLIFLPIDQFFSLPPSFHLPTFFVSVVGFFKKSFLSLPLLFSLSPSYKINPLICFWYILIIR